MIIMIMIRWEFIQHVLDTRPEQYDEHYRPVYILCATCAFKYNFILKYELINVEEALFIQEMEASGRQRCSDLQALQGACKDISKVRVVVVVCGQTPILLMLKLLA